MGTTIKMVLGGLVLFGLGGLSVYVLTKPTPDHAAVAAEIETPSAISTTSAAVTVSDSTTSEITSESFYAAADARREQQLADKAEADRLAKLKAIKERSVECKFWKQQQKTSSAAAKIDEKIDEHCNLPASSSSSESSSSGDYSAASSGAHSQ